MSGRRSFEDDRARALSWKIVRGVLGVGGALLGAAVAWGALLMRGFITGHHGTGAPTGGTGVFAVIGVAIAVLSLLAAWHPSRFTIGAAAASVAALFVAAGVL